MMTINVDEQIENIIDKLFYISGGALLNNLEDECNLLFAFMLKASSNLLVKTRVQLIFYYHLFENQKYEAIIYDFNNSNIDICDMHFSTLLIVAKSYYNISEEEECSEIAKYLTDSRHEEISNRDHDERDWIYEYANL